MSTAQLPSGSLSRQAAIYVLTFALAFSGQVQANKKLQTAIGTITAVSLALLMVDESTEKVVRGHLLGNTPGSTLPKISYSVQERPATDRSSKAFVLTPKIHRDQMLHIDTIELESAFFTRTFCTPVEETEELPELVRHSIINLCKKWFSEHTIVFPHKLLKLRPDQLDTLLLPELIFTIPPLSSDQKPLTVVAQYASYKNADGSVDHSGGASSGAIKWTQLIPGIPDVELSSDYHLCHHIPESADMARPTLEAGNHFSYNFPIPGLSHLHNGSSHIITVNINSSYGYFWKVGAPWPSNLQSFSFTRPEELHDQDKSE